MTVVKRHKEGDSLGVILPTETMSRVGFEAGQELTLIELPDGIKLVRRNARLERQLQLAQEVLLEQADVLRDLAKL